MTPSAPIVNPEPAGIPLTGFATPQRRAGLRRRAVGLRWVAIALIIGAVSALVGWAVALTAADEAGPTAG